MRKILTQAEIDKKKKKNQFVVGAVMVFLLVVSTLGYSLMSNNDDESSGVSEFGIKFFKSNGLWRAEIDGGVFGFQNLPSEILDVNVNISIGLANYSGKVLYFVSPNNGASEILNNLGGYVPRYQEACLDAENCEGDWPIKNCSDNLIIFVEANETSVYQNGGCVYIAGDGVAGADAFLYEVLKVI